MSTLLLFQGDRLKPLNQGATMRSTFGGVSVHFQSQPSFEPQLSVKDLPSETRYKVN